MPFAIYLARAESSIININIIIININNNNIHFLFCLNAAVCVLKISTKKIGQQCCCCFYLAPKTNSGKKIWLESSNIVKFFAGHHYHSSIVCFRVCVCLVNVWNWMFGSYPVFKTKTKTTKKNLRPNQQKQGENHTWCEKQKQQQQDLSNFIRNKILLESFSPFFSPPASFLSKMLFSNLETSSSSSSAKNSI